MSPADLASDFPAPRDDEPPSLRRDIADELADHLECAVRRELLANRDAAAAERGALDRFGDPRKIARKLWLDAMQEKLMSQRLTWTALIMVLLAGVGSTGVSWFLVAQARQVNQALLEQNREANAALLQQSQESTAALIERSDRANAALLTRLGEISSGAGAAAGSQQSLEWNAVQVRLYTGEKPGRPAVGFQVRLSGHILDTGNNTSITRESNAEGLVNLGLIRPGQHALHVTSPWKELREITQLVVLPGESVTVEIGCPAEPPGNATVALKPVWPADLKELGLWMVCGLRREPRIVDGQPWSFRSSLDRKVVVLSAVGEMYDFGDIEWAHPDTQGTFPFQQTGGDDLRGLFRDKQADLIRRDEVVRRQAAGTLPVVNSMPPPHRFVLEKSEPINVGEWMAGEYRISEMLVASPPQAQTRLEVIAMRSGWPKSAMVGRPAEDPSFQSLPLLAGLVPYPSFEIQQAGFRRVGTVRSNFSDWVELHPASQRQGSEQVAARRRAQPNFMAVAGQSNEWQVSLPDRLQGLVRVGLAELKQFEQAAPEQPPPAAESGSP